VLDADAPSKVTGADKGSPLGFMAEGATAGLTTAASTAAAPQQEYVDKDAQGKTDALVGLMDDSRDVLDQNSITKRGEELMAGIMRNEGGRNERRRFMGLEWNKDAAALNKLDLAHITDKQMKHLSGDQKALLDLAQKGKVDLKDPESVKNAGIDIRTGQYNRMQELSQKTDLTKAEKAELAGLKKVKVAGGGRLDDFHGMSGDRFHEIFDEGQTRFELAQYKMLRNSFERQGGKPKHDGDDMTLHASIGDTNINAQQQAQLHKNYDMLADFSTSYGTSQIMGMYAGQDKFTSKDGKGQEQSYTLDQLKRSGQRYTPTTEDVQLQLAFMHLKGVDMSNPPTALSIAQAYNGDTPAAGPYASRMLDGASAYHNARLAKDKAQRQ
jgi:hypothetical protein